MKTILYIIVFAFTFSGLKAQEQSNNKITETTIKVPGVCEMCKSRIEEAALRSKGVKFAEWDQNSKLLKLIYRNDKISVKEIEGNIAAVGHAYTMDEADSVAYENLPNCCKYKDGVSDH